MKIYSVGGYVRDTLLGLTPKDRDYVVIGETPESMLAKKFRQVGDDFPVFLHPETQDEYALARTERKSGLGSKGFSTDIRSVTLEEDLSRRDLTINAMAMDDAGCLIDPYGGQVDLERKTLRHVTQAFREDPLRVLRIARFHGRFGPDWKIADDTQALIRGMVASGEVDTVTKERVWVEFEKGLQEKHPELMLRTLTDAGLFDRPAFAAFKSGARSDMPLLAAAVRRGENVAVRFILAFYDQQDAPDFKSTKVPSEVKDAAVALHNGLQKGLLRFGEASAKDKLEILLTLDALRQEARLVTILATLDCVQAGASEPIRQAVVAIKAINQKEVLGVTKNSQEIKQKIQDARLAVLESL